MTNIEEIHKVRQNKHTPGANFWHLGKDNDMKKMKIICSLLILILVIGAVGCGQKYRTDFESEELAGSFSTKNGGISFPLAARAGFEELAGDIYNFKIEFTKDDENAITKDVKGWYIFLRDSLVDIRNEKDKRKYLVYDLKFLGSFKELYSIPDSNDEWDDHDWDGNPDWLDEDFLEQKTTD